VRKLRVKGEGGGGEGRGQKPGRAGGVKGGASTAKRKPAGVQKSGFAVRLSEHPLLGWGGGVGGGWSPPPRGV